MSEPVDILKRTHCALSPDPIVLRDVSAETGTKCGVGKPVGFWYEVDGDWRRWCEAEEFSCGSYIHAVDLGNCNIRKIDSLNKLDDFHRVFIKQDGPHKFITEIDWERVKEQWDGLEIAPYRWERRLEPGYMWYYGWDCASGVIWRPTGVTVSYMGATRKFREEAV